MNLLPIQTNPPSHPAGTPKRVPAVAPVSGPSDAVSAREHARPGVRRPAADPVQRERLIERQDELGVRGASASDLGRRAHRAVGAYASVHLASERQALNEILGVDLYA